MTSTIDKQVIRAEQRQKLFSYIRRAMQERSFDCFVTLMDGCHYPQTDVAWDQYRLKLMRDVLLNPEAAAGNPTIKEWMDNCLDYLIKKETAKQELAAASKALEELTGRTSKPDEGSR